MTKVEPILPLHIDSTMRSAFVHCPRKYFWEFILGLRAGKSVHLHAGGCFALALETFYEEFYVNKVDKERARSRAFHRFTNEWGDFIPHEKEVKTHDRMWEAFEDYIRHYGPEGDHVQPYFIDGKPTFEFSFAVPLDLPGFPMHPTTGEPFVFVGRFDMLGTSSGVPCIRDEKTSGRGGPAWASQWDLRFQFIGYTWACHQLGIPVDHCSVRGVIIHKHDFAQLEVLKYYSDWDRERWLEQFRRDLHRLVNSWNEKYFDFDLGEACNSFSGCEYKQLCKRKDPEADFNAYVVDRWNPLNRFPTKQLAPEGNAATDKPLTLEDFGDIK